MESSFVNSRSSDVGGAGRVGYWNIYFLLRNVKICSQSESNEQLVLFGVETFRV